MIIDRQLSAPVAHSDPSLWRPMIRVESRGASIEEIEDGIASYVHDRRVFAEGDSWFDKFTPIPLKGTNLLDVIRTPHRTVVFDASHIGDQSSQMVSGWQRWNTRAVFDRVGFNLILLSAGGNDLKNLFADKLAHSAGNRLSDAEKASLFDPNAYADVFDEIVGHIQSFVGMRDRARNDQTRAAPILINGYDYIQPRPARAPVIVGGNMGLGPWLYPVLKAAGLSDPEMKLAAAAVVDKFNDTLSNAFRNHPSVHVVDSRTILTPALEGSTDAIGDWLDEIHPNQRGFDKLAAARWSHAVTHHLNTP